jgi:hypothetical protein
VLFCDCATRFSGHLFIYFLVVDLRYLAGGIIGNAEFFSVNKKFPIKRDILIVI